MESGDNGPKRLKLQAFEFGAGNIKEPPSELVLAIRCKSWGALPISGGLLDQSNKTLLCMEVLYNLYTAAHTFVNSDMDFAQFRERAHGMYTIYMEGLRLRDESENAKSGN